MVRTVSPRLFLTLGAMALAQPFYLSDPARRGDMVEFLRSLDTDTNHMRSSAEESPQPPQSQAPLWAGFFAFGAGTILLKLRG